MQNLRLTCLLLTLLLPGLIIAQKGSDVPGSEDHPLISRYPGAYISWYQTEKYREYDLATGPVTGYRYIEEREKIAGQVYRMFYEIAKSPAEVSIGEVYLDYLKAMEKEGFDLLAKGLISESNSKGDLGGNGWHGVALAPQRMTGNSPAGRFFAGSSTSGGSFALIGKVERSSGPVYLAIYGRRYSKDYLQIQVDVIETAAAETGLVTVDADYLSTKLEQKGSVSIYGITFDFDKATIKPESNPTLIEIAKYLKAEPAIKLYVVGHTDMKGNLEYNQRLSTNRAQAVVDALVNEHGIAASRLEAAGLAFLAPLATNVSEAGRKENRRVELVRREK